MAGAKLQDSMENDVWLLIQNEGRGSEGAFGVGHWDFNQAAADDGIPGFVLE